MAITVQAARDPFREIFENAAIDDAKKSAPATKSRQSLEIVDLSEKVNSLQEENKKLKTDKKVLKKHVKQLNAELVLSKEEINRLQNGRTHLQQEQYRNKENNRPPLATRITSFR